MIRNVAQSLSCLFILTFLFSCSGNQQDSKKTDETFEGLVKLNGTELYCHVIGSGEPLVIVHGGPGLDHSYFLPHLNSLAAKYKLIFYDQRASGRSSLDVDTTSITIANFVEDLEAIRKHFTIEKMNLLGHSFGGFIVMNYAIKYPENLRSLMLINSNPPTRELFQSASLLDASRITREDSIKFGEILSSEEMSNGDPVAIEKLMNLSFQRQFFNRDFADSLNLSITDRFMKSSQLLGNLNNDLVSFDLTNDLRKVTCPSLVIYGDNDAFYLVSDEILYETIPNAQNWVIQDCGHFPFIEKKAEFNRILTGFLSSIHNE